ncbi:MAG: hypothetical protein U5M23_12490 [Marinagarivorans sp.]|nr:hypothetical protein [Marinagarivorans sp.]
MSIHKKLKQLNKPALVSLIAEIYGTTDSVDEIIERHLSAAVKTDDSLNRTILLQINNFLGGDEFTEYFGGDEYSARFTSTGENLLFGNWRDTRISDVLVF